MQDFPKKYLGRKVAASQALDINPAALVIEPAIKNISVYNVGETARPHVSEISIQLETSQILFHLSIRPLMWLGEQVGNAHGRVRHIPPHLEQPGTAFVEPAHIGASVKIEFTISERQGNPQPRAKGIVGVPASEEQIGAKRVRDGRCHNSALMADLNVSTLAAGPISRPALHVAIRRNRIYIPFNHFSEYDCNDATLQNPLRIVNSVRRSEDRIQARLD